MLTFRLRVVHCLPSAIRLEEYIVPDAFWSCAKRRSNEALTDENDILSAIDTTKTRIDLVFSLILVMNDFHCVTNYSTWDASASHQPAGQQNGFGAQRVPPYGVGLTSLPATPDTADRSPIGDKPGVIPGGSRRMAWPS